MSRAARRRNARIRASLDAAIDTTQRRLEQAESDGRWGDVYALDLVIDGLFADWMDHRD